MTRALIDGDEAIFRACVMSVEGAPRGSAGRCPPTLQQATETLDTMLSNWTERAGADECLVCLSPNDRKLFRRSIYSEYKSGRGEKPDHYWDLVEHVRAQHPTREIQGLEADDVMGILSGPDAVIVSGDKDLRTVPGRLYNPRTDRLETIACDEADRNWMVQTLMGDATDGFTGCIGIGAKGAERVLGRARTMDQWWPAVVREFTKPKVGKYASVRQSSKDALVQAALARILRPSDYRNDGGPARVEFKIGTASFYFELRWVEDFRDEQDGRRYPGRRVAR